jgi:hypothetical protein
MSPRHVSVLVCAALALALPAAALARVGVGGTAKNPIVHVALGKQVPRQCAAVYRSTVNRSWASVQFQPQHGWTSRCQKFGSDGVVILHQMNGRWRMVTAGSDFTCPIRHVPAAVAQDLRISCH